MRNKNVIFITNAAAIGAIYVVLTLLANAMGLANYAVQIRFSEALTVLPLFTPAAVPGLFVGCILANMLGGAIIWDVIFGSLATLIGAVVGRMLRKNRWLVPIPAIVANTVIVPLVLRYGYGENIPLLLMAVYVAVGEIISCYVLGELLAEVLLRYLNVIFKN